ncbi:MAG TPA: ATP-dependent DNA helicase UvrD2 [Mycobacteriales bacterium]
MARTDDIAPADADVLAGLDPEQREAVLNVRGPVCLLAGAGTGKTRTITHRIAHAVRTGEVPAGQLLAVTFTARAAGEMRTRLRALGVGAVQARTFHAAALRQLRYFAPRVLGGPMPPLVDNKLRLVGQAATRCRLGTDRATLRDLAAEVEWAKATLTGPQDYVAAADVKGRTPPVAGATVADVYAAYEEIKSRAGVLDFEDLLLVTAAAVEEHHDVAEEMRARYRHFVVDEYQDVSPLQQRLLDAWLGGRHDVCVVGDVNQTIYSFAGASPDYLLDFARRHPATVVVRLERDYRSTPQVVELANAIAAQSGRPAARLRLVGQRPPGPEPSYREYPDEPAEAAAVAAACRALVDGGTPASEIAVLYRVNAQSESYERSLAEAGVPYVLRGGERFFDRPEVREAMVLLRGGSHAVSPGTPLVEATRAVLSSARWAPDAPPPGGAARERWESLAAVVQVGEELAAADPQAGLGDLVAELEQRASAQHAPTVQGVTLASLHAAKGLEWDAVFIVGIADGTLPIQHATTDEQVAEERRLLYVGVTRAREHLALSWSLTRTPGGRRSRRRSRFLQGLAPETRRPTSRSARTPRPELDPAAAALFERLRAWRSTQSAEQKVPAYVVFADATLAAVAEARPRSIPELAALPGVGPRKLELYGSALLDLLRDND